MNLDSLASFMPFAFGLVLGAAGAYVFVTRNVNAKIAEYRKAGDEAVTDVAQKITSVYDRALARLIAERDELRKKLAGE